MTGSGRHRVDLAGCDALIIVDVQNDFLPGGALAVAHSDEILPPLNQYIAAFEQRGLPIYLTRDWHPANHCSFVEYGGIWPVHCVAVTHGAEFSPALQLTSPAAIVSKATTPDVECYSDFGASDFEKNLRRTGVSRLFVGGLATDYCVFSTVKDALARGFKVCLLRDAIRGVNLSPDDSQKAEAEMIRLGAVPVEVQDLAA